MLPTTVSTSSGSAGAASADMSAALTRKPCACFLVPIQAPLMDSMVRPLAAATAAVSNMDTRDATKDPTVRPRTTGTCNHLLFETAAGHNDLTAPEIYFYTFSSELAGLGWRCGSVARSELARIA